MSTPEQDAIERIRRSVEGAEKYGSAYAMFEDVEFLYAEYDRLKSELLLAQSDAGVMHKYRADALDAQCEDLTKERDELRAYKIAALAELLTLQSRNAKLEAVADAADFLVAAPYWEGSTDSVRETQHHIFSRILRLRVALAALETEQVKRKDLCPVCGLPVIGEGDNKYCVDPSCFCADASVMKKEIKGE